MGGCVELHGPSRAMIWWLRDRVTVRLSIESRYDVAVTYVIVRVYIPPIMLPVKSIFVRSLRDTAALVILLARSVSLRI